LRGPAYVVLDAGSQSGTFVNGAPIAEHTLRSGDVLRLGRTTFIYQDDQLADDGQATQPMPLRLD
jgi:pSer/pThr/pTyr-binding forkhead associated (FHA) protein